MSRLVGLLTLMVVISSIESHFVPFQKIEAETCVTPVDTYDSCDDDSSVWFINSTDDTVVYTDGDFQTGAEMIDMRLKGLEGGGTILLTTYSHATGTSLNFASITIQKTNGTDDDCTFITLSSFLQKIPSGVNDLLIQFKAFDKHPFVKLDWFMFKATAS